MVRQENLHKNPLYEDNDFDDLVEGVDPISSSSAETSADEEGQREQDAKDGSTTKKKRRRLVVLSNHVTPFDHFALSTVMPCIKVSYWLIVIFLCVSCGLLKIKKYFSNNIIYLLSTNCILCILAR